MSSVDCGRFIAELRKSKRITQTELADLLKVSNSAISRWETGEGYPDISIFPRLAEILNVSVDELLKGQRITKESSLNKKGSTNVRFKKASMGSTILLLASFLLFVAITYSTYKVWYGVIGFIIPVTATWMWFIFSRNDMLDVCDYNDDDKQMIYDRTLSFYSILIIIFLMIIPQIYVASDSSFTDTVIKLEFYVRWIVIVSIIGVFITTLIRHIHYKKQLKANQNTMTINSQEWFVLTIILVATLIITIFQVYFYIIPVLLPVSIFLFFTIYLYVNKVESRNIFLYRLSVILAFFIMSLLFFLSPGFPENHTYSTYELIFYVIIPYGILAYMTVIFIISIIGIIKSIKPRNNQELFRVNRHIVMTYIAILATIPLSMYEIGSMFALIPNIVLFLILEHYMEKMTQKFVF